ncbi:MAG: Rab family GTPase [Candidatus Njordarchaeota archaeon]
MTSLEQRLIRVKVVFIGNDAVGKTSIAKRYLGHGFDVQYKSTIGADFYIKRDSYTFPSMGPYQIEWMIWDLAGQEYFNIVRPIYYNKARAAIIVFDVSRPDTFKALPNWIREFWQYTGGIYPFIIVGNKIDLRNEQSCVPPEYGKRYADTLTRQLGFPIPYVETSAKTGHNIKEAFEILAQTIIRFALVKARKGM